MNKSMIADPFRFTSGARDAEVILVGEAWGAEEATAQRPFVGQAGKELDRMLFEAGLRRDQILCTNLVDTRPNLENDFAAGFTQATKEPGVLFRGLNCTEILTSGLAKLDALIAQVKPRLVIGCGNWPLWALTEHPVTSDKSTKSKVDGKSRKLPVGITKWRGSQTFTKEIQGVRYPFLPIFHPAAILRDWTLRHVTVHDLRARAARFLTQNTSWEAPPRRALPAPSFEQALSYLLAILSKLDSGRECWIACDVETYERKSISCVGIATDELGALCIPFFYFPSSEPNTSSVNYWTLQQEFELSRLLRAVLTHAFARVTNQNIIYDAQYLNRNYGIRLTPAFDTMVAHHLGWPGTPKNLGYLSSLYCDHHLYWKDDSDEWNSRSMGHLDLWSYNCEDTLRTLEITHVLRQSLSQLGMAELMAGRMFEWQLAFAIMRRGTNYDQELRLKYRSDLMDISNELTTWLLEAMPENLRYSGSTPWFRSPIFQREIFYDRLKIAPILHKKTKQPTLDKEALEQLRKKATWLAPIFDRLEIMRSIGVYSENFLNIRLMPNGRFGTEFDIAGPESFRWASRKNAFDEGGNFQNIPKKEEE